MCKAGLCQRKKKITQPQPFLNTMSFNSHKGDSLMCIEDRCFVHQTKENQFSLCEILYEHTLLVTWAHRQLAASRSLGNDFSSLTPRLEPTDLNRAKLLMEKDLTKCIQVWISDHSSEDSLRVASVSEEPFVCPIPSKSRLFLSNFASLEAAPAVLCQKQASDGGNVARGS